MLLDAVFEFQEANHARLRDAGYQRYEISAFAKPGLECRHNLNYWSFGDYLAVGAGAHGKITDASGKIWRYQKPAHPMSYIGTATTPPKDAQLRELGADDIVFEYMLNVLRLPAGFVVSEFEERTGLNFAAIRDKLDRCRETGTLVCDDGRCWRPTELGLRFGNDLQAQFLPSRGAA